MKRDWWNQEFKTLVTLGESTTAGGWSSCRERCWASQLALETKSMEENIPPWRDESTLRGEA